MNLLLAHTVLQQMYLQGVREIAVCAGARNAAFVHLLQSNHPFQVYSFFDERAASFFALGVCKRSSRPCAVLTTSGTAVSETYSAVIEAHYTGLPLVIVSADRPKSYRGSCAPQAIEQQGIFGVYAHTVDIDALENSSFVLCQNKVTHLNVCFDEPLIDADSKLPQWQEVMAAVSSDCEVRPSTRLQELLREAKNPLVIVGALSPSTAVAVAEKLSQQSIALYLEATSNISRSFPTQIRHLDKVKPGSFDAVIRVGLVPTTRFWRDLEKNPIATISFSDVPFPGLSWDKQVPESIATFLATEFEARYRFESLLEADRLSASRLQRLFELYPNSEPAMIRALSQCTTTSDDVFIGNSLPIRFWDLAAQSPARLYCNRGVNGIDGLISTAFGSAEASRRMWVVLGDLSALYDLNSLAMIPSNLSDIKICVVNNGGGKIFHRMFGNALFENRHNLNFANWAEMFGWDYANTLAEVDRSQTRQIIELQPSQRCTDEFLDAWVKN